MDRGGVTHTVDVNLRVASVTHGTCTGEPSACARHCGPPAPSGRRTQQKLSDARGPVRRRRGHRACRASGTHQWHEWRLDAQGWAGGRAGGFRLSRGGGPRPPALPPRHRPRWPAPSSCPFLAAAPQAPRVTGSGTRHRLRAAPVWPVCLRTERAGRGPAWWCFLPGAPRRGRVQRPLLHLRGSRVLGVRPVSTPAVRPRDPRAVDLTRGLWAEAPCGPGRGGLCPGHGCPRGGLPHLCLCTSVPRAGTPTPWDDGVLLDVHAACAVTAHGVFRQS